MPLDSTGWTPTPAGERIAQIRAELDAAAGMPLDYCPGTWEGAWTTTAGVLAARVEADVSVLPDSLSPETAAGANLDRIGAFRGIPRRAATASRYIVYPTLGAGFTTVSIPAGTVLRDADRQQWQTVEAIAAADALTPVAVEAVEAGPVELDDGTLTMVTPVIGMTGATYDSADGDPVSIGRTRETDAQYRIRLRQSLSLGSGASAPGVRTALLDLDWVQAVDVTRPSAGVVAVYIVPAPVGADQRTQLAETLLRTLAGGIATAGDDSETVTVDGVTDTISWYGGSDLPVAIEVEVVLASGYTLADVTPGVTLAVQALVATLTRGQPLRILQVLAAVAPVEGITGATVQLDGGSADIVPASTELIVVGGDVVVTT